MHPAFAVSVVALLAGCAGATVETRETPGPDATTTVTTTVTSTTTVQAGPRLVVTPGSFQPTGALYPSDRVSLAVDVRNDGDVGAGQVCMTWLGNSTCKAITLGTGERGGLPFTFHLPPDASPRVVTFNEVEVAVTPRPFVDAAHPYEDELVTVQVASIVRQECHGPGYTGVISAEIRVGLHNGSVPILLSPQPGGGRWIIAPGMAQSGDELEATVCWRPEEAPWLGRFEGTVDPQGGTSSWRVPALARMILATPP